jgi:hypothetical protein
MRQYIALPLPLRMSLEILPNSLKIGCLAIGGVRVKQVQREVKRRPMSCQMGRRLFISPLVEGQVLLWKVVKRKIKSNDENGDEEKVTAPKKGKKVKEEDTLNGEAKKPRTAKASGADTKVKRKAKEEIESDGTTPTKRRVSARR